MIRRGPVLVFFLVLGGATGCATQPQEDADTPQSPQHLACGGEVRQMQASCSSDLLRTQGSDCSAATAHIVDHCQAAQ